MSTASKFGKRIASTIVAGCLSVACMGLVACGGGTASSSAGSAGGASSASVSTDSGSTTSTKTFVGKWKIAAAQLNGLTLAGKFGQIIGADENSGLEIKEDGTGTLTLGGETDSLTWTEAGADTIDITVKSSAAGSETTVPQSTRITAKDDALFLTIKQENQEGSLIFTADGKYAGAMEINLDEAKDITSESELIGTWNLVGMDMAGITMYGEGDALQQQLGQAGSSASTLLTLEKGGSVKTGSETSGSATWAVDSKGATMTMDGLDGKVNLPIKKLGDQLAVDYTQLLAGLQIVFVYGK